MSDLPNFDLVGFESMLEKYLNPVSDTDTDTECEITDKDMTDACFVCMERLDLSVYCFSLCEHGHFMHDMCFHRTPSEALLTCSICRTPATCTLLQCDTETLRQGYIQNPHKPPTQVPVSSEALARVQDQARAQAQAHIQRCAILTHYANEISSLYTANQHADNKDRALDESDRAFICKYQYDEKNSSSFNQVQFDSNRIHLLRLNEAKAIRLLQRQARKESLRRLRCKQIQRQMYLDSISYLI